ncbi:MAG: hypothetical protein F7C36_00325 [Desulfurococcales archaeon]|nr:hypothetical protein [Desulfurococcales archaeon]
MGMYRIQVVLGESLYERLKRVQAENGFLTMSETLRYVIKKGLDAINDKPVAMVR